MLISICLQEDRTNNYFNDAVYSNILNNVRESHDS